MLGRMVLLRGHVEGGQIVVDEPVDLPEGAQVEIALLGDDEMSSEERAEVEASIELGLEQAARGETVPLDEVLRRLRET